MLPLILPEYNTLRYLETLGPSGTLNGLCVCEGMRIFLSHSTISLQDRRCATVTLFIVRGSSLGGCEYFEIF